MNPREQGDLGELFAAMWLVGRGAAVAFPFGHSPHWDLIAEVDGQLLRVQVKTSRSRRNGRWKVTICTRGGNQSWTGLVKRMDSSRCDYLYAHVGDGRRWFIPTVALECGNEVTLGGPKYSEFEVDRGLPIPLERLRSRTLESSADARGDARAVKGNAL
jgi:hypothetical protein